MCIDEFFHPLNEITLQLHLILEPQCLHKVLTVSTVLPRSFWTFISANVNIFRREYFKDLSQDIFQKLKSLLFWTINIFENSPLCCNLISFCTVAREIWKTVKRAKRMARHLYLRNYRNISFRCIFYNLLCLLLGIIPAIRRAVINP